MTAPVRLATRCVEKVWGRTSLPQPFACPGDEPVGEIWFEPDGSLPDLLAKYLFTSAKLSVQVHPRDGEAGPGIPGKDECWLVLDAEPGASLAIGFCEAISADAMRAAALDGSIEHLLEWHQVSAGDFFYLPAGTVHAIGAGISLVEVQQNTDITYRLFDYGRPRELHLDAALAVAEGKPYPRSLMRKLAEREEAMLVDGPKFRLAQSVGAPGAELAERFTGPCQILPLGSAALVDGTEIAAGESCVIASLSGARIETEGRLLLCSSCS